MKKHLVLSSLLVFVVTFGTIPIFAQNQANQDPCKAQREREAQQERREREQQERRERERQERREREQKERQERANGWYRA